MNDEEFGSLKLLQLKCRRGDQIIQPFCRISSPQEIRSTLFNLYKFQKFGKGIPESCRMHGNLINGEKFGPLKLLKLKCRRGDQMIQSFCRIGPSHEIRYPSLICGNFKSLRKVVLNHAECIEI